MSVKRINRVFDIIENIGASLVVTIIVVVLSLQVLFRDVFNSPLYWSEELARYCFMWSVFLGAAFIYRRGSHMSIDFFVNVKNRGCILKLVKQLEKIIVTAFSLFLLVIGLDFANTMKIIQSPAIGIPLGYVYTIIPIFSALSVLFIWIKPVKKEEDV